MKSLQQIGPYRVDAQLGKGGMGVVYRAFDSRLNRMVAVKVMRSGGSGQTPAIDRFLLEARAASALNHPNIITIYDIGETPDGDHFIVQELVNGRTLRELLQGPLTPEAVIDIGAQVARALASAHAAGIVHRDIKPENIMVRTDGYAKVLDFGIARIVERVSPPDAITRALDVTKPGMLMGTTAYMSPEQAKGEIVGPPSDVFALGTVLYEIASKTRPFDGGTPMGVLASIISEQPIPLARLNPVVPAALDALVHRMLDKVPERRPSARDVELALVSMQTGAAVVAPPTVKRNTVGREAERAELRRAYARARAGRSLLVGVSGEAGIGKTSLVEDFLAELTSDPDRPIVARGRCSEQLAGNEAYLPILEALDNLLRRGAGVATVMKAVAPTWYLQVDTLGSDDSGRVEAREQIDVSQERMKREIGVFFQEVSRSQPVILAFEDLHWADISTIDLLNYLAAHFDDMRVLVLVTYRQAEMQLASHPFLTISHDLQSRGVFEELPLGFLTLAEVGSYLDAEFPGHAFPHAFIAMIYAKTEGSPLFMADLVRYLRDSGGVAQDKDKRTWVIDSSVSASAHDLPASVRGMIARKIERLSEDDRRLLIAASVQGREFDSATLAEAIKMDPGETEERLDVLERVHVFVKRGAEQEFPDRTLTLKYQFVHALYQNTFYAALQPTRRATISGRVATALVTHYGQDTASISGRLAVLFETARDFAASARYFIAAVQHALGLFAFQEALLLADRGLAAVRGLPEGPERLGQELTLQMLKGAALRSTTGWATPELEQTFARARQLCQQLGDPPQVFPVLWATTLFHLIRGNHVECRSRADELMVKAAESGNPALLMAAHHMAGVSREFMGEMAESSRLLERARDLHDPAQHLAYTAMYGSDPGMIARAMSSRPLWALGYPDRALERARETLTIAQSQRQPLTRAFAQVVLHGVLAYRGDGAEAIGVGDQNIALCREHGLPQEAEWSRSFQGSALITAGRTDEGIDLLKDSLAVQEQLKTHLARPMFLALLAEGFREAGRVSEGLQAVEEGFLWAERISEAGYVAELHRMRGELLRLSGNDAAAEDSLRAALDRARTQQAKSFELRAATGLANLLKASARASEGRAMLATAYEWFTEGHTTRDLMAARNTLSGMA